MVLSDIVALSRPRQHNQPFAQQQQLQVAGLKARAAMDHGVHGRVVPTVVAADEDGTFAKPQGDGRGQVSHAETAVVRVVSCHDGSSFLKSRRCMAMYHKYCMNKQCLFEWKSEYICSLPSRPSFRGTSACNHQRSWADHFEALHVTAHAEAAIGCQCLIFYQTNFAGQSVS